MPSIRRIFWFVLFSVTVITASACSPDDEFAGSADSAVAGDGVLTSIIDLNEFSISGDLTVAAGHIVVEVTNRGAAPHNLVLEGGPKTSNLANGEQALLDLGKLSPGTYTLFCEIPGHQGAGMQATLTVVSESDSDTLVDTAGHTDDEPDWARLDATMLDSIRAFPAETEGSGNTLLEPTVLRDGTKEFELTASIEQWEVEPGKFVDAWTYNGQVPGPHIRVDVGDKIRVNVQNDLPMGTDIHWHGVRTPNDMDGVAPITQHLIESGDSFVYEFEATRPSIGMYHAHHHGHVQIPNGLFGVFTIGELPIPRGKTIGDVTIPADIEVAHEIPMVLNDAGVIGYSLNGKSFPATEPYVVEEGDWIAITYYNEGLQIHPMHLHQFPQLVFAKDGFPLDHPYWADTVNVAPGERYTVLVQADTLGTWVWHCHILTHVEHDEGMFGMVTAMIVT